MRVFVTGGAGFLGQHLVARLKSLGFRVDAPTRMQCDLLYPLDRKKESYDYIYHLAAWTQAGDFCLKYPGDQWVKNQLINTNVLEWWSREQPQAKLIFMGTSCVYSPLSLLSEDEFMLGEPIESLYTYAMTKRMLYQGARALSRQHELRYLCAVPSTLYGAGYHTDGRQMHFIFDLIRKIIRAKEFGDEAVLWGDGHQRREIVLVEDFVSILLDLNQRFDNEIFNIGAGEDYSIREFAQFICDYVGFDFNQIRFDENRYVGARSKCLSMEKTGSKLGPLKMTSLKDGLERTIDWFYSTTAYK